MKGSVLRAYVCKLSRMKLTVATVAKGGDGPEVLAWMKGESGERSEKKPCLMYDSSPDEATNDPVGRLASDSSNRRYASLAASAGSTSMVAGGVDQE